MSCPLLDPFSGFVELCELYHIIKDGFGAYVSNGLRWLRLCLDLFYVPYGRINALDVLEYKILGDVAASI